MTVDLDVFSNLAAVQEEGIDVDIMGPDGEPLGWTIRMAGPDSERARRAERRMINGRLGIRKPTAESIEDEVLQGIAEMTISWTPVILFGADLPCTVENAKKVYSTPSLRFVFDQINIAAGDRARFFSLSQKGSAKPSKKSKRG